MEYQKNAHTHVPINIAKLRVFYWVWWAESKKCTAPVKIFSGKSTVSNSYMNGCHSYQKCCQGRIKMTLVEIYIFTRALAVTMTNTRNHVIQIVRHLEWIVIARVRTTYVCVTVWVHYNLVRTHHQQYWTNRVDYMNLNKIVDVLTKSDVIYNCRPGRNRWKPDHSISVIRAW